MLVHLFPADEGACGAYRLLEPARIASLQGVETVIKTAVDVGIYQDNINGSIVRKVNPIDADVVVFQRPARPFYCDYIQQFQAKGVLVVVDMDDDFTSLHPNHGARMVEETDGPGTNWKNAQKACALADLVTVTTPALAERYASHGRFAVLPNLVPAKLLDMGRDSDGHTVGWSGAARSHPGDLEVTYGGVEMALDGTDWRFLKIGDEEEAQQRLGLSKMDVTGALPLDEYHVALGKLDIGIAPLRDTRFNQAKSGLKFLEMAARGVPCIGSPLPEYEKLAAEGIGLLAKDRGRSWKAAIKALMVNTEFREATGAHYKHLVAENHTFEKEGWRWAEAWQSAIENRRSRSRQTASGSISVAASSPARVG